MAEPAELGFIWGRLAEQVARQLDLNTNRSPTLTSVVERGVRYIKVDDHARELVFDTRALVIGFLATGRGDPDSIRYGNTASWFVTWLEEKIGQDVVDQAQQRTQMADASNVAGAIGAGSKVVLSSSVRGLVGVAEAIARSATGRNPYEARHLFAAMIEKGVVLDQVRQLFKVDLTGKDIMNLRVRFIERIMGAPDPNETVARWYETLGIGGALDPLGSDASAAVINDVTYPSAAIETGAGSSTARAFAAPIEGVAGFHSDRASTGADDPLDTSADARALARLICLDDAAPMAVAIFGGWGSGKSTFMATLDREVDSIVKSEASRRSGDEGEQAPSDGAATFISRVVQMRFNAWQFVDANLWTSLTAEFFDQLRAGGWNQLDQARHAGLVERVNRHVHSLSAEVEATRDAAAASDKELLAAQRDRDNAAEKAKAATGHALGQAAIDLLSDTYDSQKSNLTKLGMTVAGIDTGGAVDALIDVVRSSRTVVGQVFEIWKLLQKTGLRFWMTIISAGVFASALLIFLFWNSSHADFVSLVVAIGALGSMAKAAEPAVKLVRAVAERGNQIAQSVEKADQETLKGLLQTEIHLREVSREAAALQSSADGAARRLSRYVDPGGVANPPRLLRYILEDDPDTKALAAEIGLIGRTRRLFQAVDDIVRAERQKPTKDRVDGDVPDRIVLYIDDLDRCTEEQVYAVLQATHLLLAFDLFVVVVGVDVNWIHRALAKTLGVTNTKDADLRQRASSYLDKIFQVAFWLSPLKRTGADGGSYARYVRSLAEPRSSAMLATLINQAPSVNDSSNTSDSENNYTDIANTQQVLSESINANPNILAARLIFDNRDEGAVIEKKALRTLELLPEEIDFLASTEIGSIASSTPRGVKRLVNVYRLVRTRLSEITRDETWGEGPDYPLIALTAAIETGQSVEIADAFYSWLLSLEDEAEFEEAFTALNGEDLISGRIPHSILITNRPEMIAVIQAVSKIRGNLRAIDVSRIAKITRRYSFNRYF